MHIRNLEMIKDIQAMLGDFGKIYLYPHKLKVHYAITKKAELIILIYLISPMYILLTSYLLLRFLVILKVLLLEIIFFPTLEFFNVFRNDPTIVVLYLYMFQSFN